MPQKSVSRSRGCRIDGSGAGRLHLCFVSIISYAKAELDGRLAPDLISDSTGTDGLTQGGRLDRHVVSSGWHDLDQTQRWRQAEHRGRAHLPGGTKCSHWGARRNGGSDSRNDIKPKSNAWSACSA